jgi:hypothetical protein
MVFGLVIFAKIKLHAPSPIIRSATHAALTRLIFVGKLGKLRDNNLSKSRGNMWL